MSVRAQLVCIIIDFVAEGAEERPTNNIQTQSIDLNCVNEPKSDTSRSDLCLGRTTGSDTGTGDSVVVQLRTCGLSAGLQNMARARKYAGDQFADAICTTYHTSGVLQEPQ